MTWGQASLGLHELWQYIPPERTDGLLPECEEEESVNEEAIIEVIWEDSCVTAAKDLDLD